MPVHNHGTEEGKGLACPELLVGDCIINTIYVVYCENQDSTTGVDFTGIFNERTTAENFAESEGEHYKVAETTFGPIDWKVFNPLPPFDWNNV